MGTKESASPGVHVPVLDGRRADWIDAVKHLVELGKNFLIILRDDQKQIDQLRDVLDYSPPKLEKWEPYEHHNVLTNEDKERLKDAEVKHDPIFFAEMLKRPIVRPPRTKPYVVYCEQRGMIAETDHEDEAKVTCRSYAGELARQHQLPSARVYRWNGSEWEPLRFPCV